MEVAEDLTLDILWYVYRLTRHPSILTFETNLRNAERHRGTVFVSFIFVSVMGSIWILIWRRNIERGNENVSTQFLLRL